MVVVEVEGVLCCVGQTDAGQCGLRALSVNLYTFSSQAGSQITRESGSYCLEGCEGFYVLQVYTVSFLFINEYVIHYYYYTLFFK